MVSQEYEYNFKLAFKAEWFDNIAERQKNFLLTFYPCDDTVELYDVDTKKLYLKRSKFNLLTLKDVYVGSILLIYGRQIRVTDYADCLTQKFIGRWKERTFAIIKPSGMNNLGEIIDEIFKNNFMIDRMRMAQLSRKDALDLYAHRKGDAFLPFVIEHISSAPLVAMELVGEKCIDRWRELMGPPDPNEARRTAPNSFRARFGNDLAGNAVHGSSSYEEAQKSACFFFPQGINKSPPPSTARIKNSTCCVIKPHVTESGHLGQMIDFINHSAFQITALKMIYLSRDNADEFLEVYKGVICDYYTLQNSFLNGPCIALEISGRNENMDVHKEFRWFCGPRDSNVAKQIRPRSIRGVFGVDRYLNACHCTDLTEDSTIELEYFFKILDS